MKFLELDLTGFGKLVQTGVEFAPGFNLIYGQNEAGKSTLQTAMLALLYSFYGSGRATQARTDEMMAFQPWDQSAPFQASLSYSLDKGHTFRVCRTFGSRPSTTLLTYPDLKDVSRQYKSDNRGRLFFAEDQLGMEREVFEATCFVRQSQLTALSESANAITNTLMRFSTSASSDTTVTDALAQLEEAFKEQVGTDRASAKPLRQAKDRLASLEREYGGALDARRDLLTATVELRQLEQELDRLTLEQARCHYLETVVRQTSNQQQLATYTVDTPQDDPAEQEVARWEVWADFPVHLADQINKLASQHAVLQGECAEMKPHVEQAQATLSTLQVQIDETQARVAALADEGRVRVDDRPVIERLAAEWRYADTVAKQAQAAYERGQNALKTAGDALAEQRRGRAGLLKLDHAGLAELRQQWRTAANTVKETARAKAEAEREWTRVGMTEDEYRDLEKTVKAIRSGKQPPPPPRSGCGSLFGGGEGDANRTPSEVTIYADVQPIYADMQRARLDAERAQKALITFEATAARRLGVTAPGATITDATFTEAERQLTADQRTATAIDQQKAQVAALLVESRATQTRAKEARAALLTQLGASGIRGQDPQMALDAYLAQCERNTQRNLAEGQLERLQVQASAPQHTLSTWRSKQDTLQRVAQQLCALLAQADIESTPQTIEDGLASYNAGLVAHRQWKEAKAIREAGTRHPRIVLDGQMRARLEAEQSQLETELAQARHTHPEWEGLQPGQSLEDYAREARRLEQARVQVHDAHQRVQDSNQQMMARLRHPAELDEEIAVLKSEIQRLERYGKILKAAQDELDAAAHKFQAEFAPRVEELMTSGLSQITGGRYGNVQVDPKNLAVSVPRPETRELVKADRLSTGTQDLVYLILRISLARLMSQTDEILPLLLDDPMVHYDRSRQERALRFLAELAAQTQILLFTKDDFTKGWFEQTQVAVAGAKLHILR